MALSAPDAMEQEHLELHRELEAATRLPGKVGAAAKAVAAALHPHFIKEEEFALPPLGVIRRLARSKAGRLAEPSRDEAKAMELSDLLKAELPKMLREHRAIVAALERLERAARSAGRPEVVSFAAKLRLHAQTEEQLTYPAAILVGEYLKLKGLLARGIRSGRAQAKSKR